MELALGVDTSRSMDKAELELQREGYARALESPELMAVLDRAMLGKIAVTYFDWGGTDSRSRPKIDVILPWTVIATPKDAARAAAVLRAAPTKWLFGTGISGAVTSAIEMIETNDYEGLRKVIDISGDGPNNEGWPVLSARHKAEQAGIQVNGLPIMLKSSGWSYTHLEAYFQDCVIAGPGAFVIPVYDVDKLADSILRKMVLEVAGAAPPARIRTARLTDCLIGEKRREAWDDG